MDINFIKDAVVLVSLLVAPLFISYLLIKRTRYFLAFLSPLFTYFLLFILISMVVRFGGFAVVGIAPLGMILNTIFVTIYYFSDKRKLSDGLQKRP
jgi:hypothetical protein